MRSLFLKVFRRAVLLGALAGTSCSTLYVDVAAGPLDGEFPVLVGPVHRIGGEPAGEASGVPGESVALSVGQTQWSFVIPLPYALSFTINLPPSISSPLGAQLASHLDRPGRIANVREVHAKWWFFSPLPLSVERFELSLEVDIR